MSASGSLAVATTLARCFERHGIRYILGGSMASTSYGEPRSTLDADFAADLDLATFEPWADDAERHFLFDREWARSEVEARGSFQILHRTELLRVDVFVPPWEGLDLWKWEHRNRISLGATDEALDVTSAEGIVLQKLRWFESGGRTSDRQWRDLVGVLSHQRSRIDRSALAYWATHLGLEDLLERALRDAGQEEVALRPFAFGTSARFFKLERTQTPWGDYGAVLVHGLAPWTRRDQPRASLSLKRAGPFVPAVTLPGVGHVVVTDALRRWIEAAGLSGVKFLPVVVELAVRIEWTAWDRSAPLPLRPSGGEPENLLPEARHDARLLESMPRLWELVAAVGVTEVRRETPTSPDGFTIEFLPGSWKGLDVFGGTLTSWTYVSERARDVLAPHVGEWCTLRPLSES